MGLNPYKTNEQLYYELIGAADPEDISAKPYVQFGIKAEPALRQLFRLNHPELKISYRKNNLVTRPDLPGAHASLDGWTADKAGRLGILEIKTTEIMASQHKEKWRDRIPDNYYIQLLHYMMITGAEYADLTALLRWRFSGSVLQRIQEYHIEREEVAEDIALLEHSERQFIQAVKDRRKPALTLPAI